MEVTLAPAAAPLIGSVRPPGDKSISHRAVLFASMAQGTSTLTGVLDSEDVRSTVQVATSLGAQVDLEPGRDGLHGTVTGWGESGPRPTTDELDCGNSGTTCRLMMGVLAGWPVRVRFAGDDSLSQRPMKRISSPLASMGAHVETTDGHLPVTVRGGDLSPLAYESPVASAQVKSSILLAGLAATGTTSVTEPAPSRDHTERILPSFGVRVSVSDDYTSSVVGPQTLQATSVSVPGDPSSAAFHAVAASIVPDSQVKIEGVSLNATRSGYLEVLDRMGVEIEIETADARSSEPAGALTICGPPVLRPTTVAAREVPSLIDEIPVLAVAAALADGVTRFEGVAELRVKESDRLTAIQTGLAGLGIEVDVEGDVLSITGGTGFKPATLDSLGDHRLAMSWAVAALRATAPMTITGFEAVDVSYPGFLSDLRSLSGS